MTLKTEMVTFDCSNPVKLAGWWAENFDGKVQELIPGEFIAVIRSEGPRIGFQQVSDPTPGKIGCTWISARLMWTPKFPDSPPPAPPRSAGTASVTTFAG